MAGNRLVSRQMNARSWLLVRLVPEPLLGVSGCASPGLRADRQDKERQRDRDRGKQRQTKTNKQAAPLEVWGGKKTNEAVAPVLYRHVDAPALGVLSAKELCPLPMSLPMSL